jgi:hypothetical protein
MPSAASRISTGYSKREDFSRVSHRSPRKIATALIK